MVTIIPKFRMSLLLCTLLLSLVIASDAKAFDSLHQVSHNRFLKKRAPAPQLGGPGPIIGAGANPTVSATETTPSASAATTSATASAPTSSSSSTSSPSSSTSATSSGGLLGSVVSGLLPTTSTSVSLSSSTSSASSSSTQSTSSSVQTSAAAPSATAVPTQVVSPTSAAVVYITDTSSASASASASATPSSLSSSSTGITHTALIVLIVVAASVGGSIIIWTIIRKWKFGKSSNFDDRMQPIDWQPSAEDGSDTPGMNRRHSNASSFHSGHAPGGSGTTVLNPIPDHDFTPGPANLAPVGGYADLARGPSPQPMMQELARGPSFSRQYQSDPYGVPLHHGGYGTGY